MKCNYFSTQSMQHWVLAFPTIQKQPLALPHYFPFIWPCIVTDFLIIKPTRCTNFSNLFWNETLQVSDSSSVRHQELFVVGHPDPARKLPTNLYDTYHHRVYSVNNSWCQTEEPFETWRVSFQNKFEKLVHLVGFIIRKRPHHYGIDGLPHVASTA
jgi:hypothetical protein